MQIFFNDKQNVQYGILGDGRWDNTRDTLLRNLVTTKSYFRSRVQSVKSNHFLCRLLNSLTIPYSLNIERYFANISNKALGHSMQMGMTSPIFRGNLFSGVFYDPGGYEIIINDSSWFDVFDADANWKTQQSVKVLCHQKSNLDMLLPNGKETSIENGISAISINIPMLAIQYRRFLLEEANKREEDIKLTTAHFVHMYVLPNMMDSHVDMCLFNRFNNLSQGKPNIKANKRQPFALTDVDGQVDSIYLNLLKNIENNGMEYKKLLRTIPAVSQKNMEDVLTMTENSQTRQQVWADIVYRLPAVDMLTRFTKSLAVGSNGVYNSYFVRFFRYELANSSLQSILPSLVYIDTSLTITEILNRIKSS